MDSRPQPTNQILVKIRTITFHKVLSLLLHVIAEMAKRKYLMKPGKLKLDLVKIIGARHSYWIQAKQARLSAERARCTDGGLYFSVYCRGGPQNVTVVKLLHQSISQPQEYVLRTCCAHVVLVAIELNFLKSANKTGNGVDPKV